MQRYGGPEVASEPRIGQEEGGDSKIFFFVVNFRILRILLVAQKFMQESYGGLCSLEGDGNYCRLRLRLLVLVFFFLLDFCVFGSLNFFPKIPVSGRRESDKSDQFVTQVSGLKLFGRPNEIFAFVPACKYE